jgi:hypothetical protein
MRKRTMSTDADEDFACQSWRWGGPCLTVYDTSYLRQTHTPKKEIESTWAGREVGGRAVNEGGQTREADEEEQD